jgi:stage II sporulation protein P
MSTVKSILETNSTIENVIDLHRDAVGSDSSYGPTVKIGDEVVAQIMFVIGTDGGGLNHPNWQQNLKLAVKVQEKANEMYPGLFRPIIVRNSRYNQNLAKGACIIEVGATGNTLEECMGSMKYLAKVISEVMK